MPPTQYPLSSKAAPPPNSRDAFPSLQQGADPLGWGPRDPKGTPGCPRVPKGAFGALGGMGPRGSLGFSEAIPNGTPFRLDGYYETTPKLKPWLESRMEGKVSKCYQNCLDDQGSLRSEIMPTWYPVHHLGCIGREMTKQFVSTREHVPRLKRNNVKNVFKKIT